jgi:hypothetical protein
VKAINEFGPSIESDVNALSAIIQGIPADYSGTLVSQTVTKDTITITWTDVTDPALYGYSAITGWRYG